MNRKALFIVVSIMFAVLLCGCQSETSTGPEPITESKLTLETVEMFNTIEDAETRFNYISEISKTAPMFNEYEYINGKVILRVSRFLTPEQAAEYENTLSELLK
jgi:hypothetical protein